MRYSFFLISLFLFLMAPQVGLAVENSPLDVLKQAGGEAGLKPKTEEGKTLTQRVGILINYILGIIGTVAVIYAIYGGTMWITAAGSSEKVKTAQKIIINACLGIIAVSMAYLIVSLAISAGAGQLGT
ncbi:MAG: hypothetical protein HY602_00250 [Parcubacteria group bacterium]|nr:hypothetical protein [Parcubacteria group bacterium]